MYPVLVPPRLAFTPLLALLLLHGTARARPIDPAAVDAIVQEGLKAWRVPGAAVAVVHGGETYLQGHGVRELGSANRVTPDTIFAIGSCTKAFATTAMAILVDEEKIAWDDPVRKHVEFFRLADPLADRDVTLRDLVCHRTGLSRHDLLWYRAPWSLEETVRRIGQVRPAHSFRSTYEYNNVMYITAGFAITAAAKTPWHDFVQKRLFDPLGMTGAVFSSSAAQKAPDHASPHLKRAAGKVEGIPWYNDDPQIRASGSIKASVRDLSKWLRLQLDGGTVNGKRLVSEASLRETHRPQVVRPLTHALARETETTQASYGLGWSILDYRGHLLSEHGGSVDGFRAHVALVPKAGLAVVVLCNLGQSDFPVAVCRSLLDQALGLARKDWNTIHADLLQRAQAAEQKERDAKRRPGTRPSRELESYTGSYQHPGYGSAVIAKDGDSLVVQWSSFKLRLGHYHFDTFLTRTEDARELVRVGNQMVIFQLGADGEVAEVKFLGQDFKKTPARAAGP